MSRRTIFREKFLENDNNILFMKINFDYLASMKTRIHYFFRNRLTHRVMI